MLTRLTLRLLLAAATNLAAASPADGNYSGDVECWWREAHDCCDRSGTERLPPQQLERALREIARDVIAAGPTTLATRLGGPVVDYLRNVHKHHANAGAASLQEMFVLSAATLWVARWHGLSTIGSVETGFAQGHSALAIVGAAHGAGLAINHTALDPYQTSRWRDNGRRELAAFDARFPSARRRFAHVPTTAAAGLADMQRSGACVQLAFMDDGHKFDDNMVELYFIGLMLPVLGVLIIDDTAMPSVASTGSFIERNLPMRRVAVTHRYVVYVKTGRDTRRWDHYRPFKADFKRAHKTKGGGLQFMRNVTRAWQET